MNGCVILVPMAIANVQFNFTAFDDFAGAVDVAASVRMFVPNVSVARDVSKSRIKLTGDNTVATFDLPITIAYNALVLVNYSASSALVLSGLSAKPLVGATPVPIAAMTIQPAGICALDLATFTQKVGSSVTITCSSATNAVPVYVDALLI